jgi:membrane carboxypeptidase/penicillin-binding protein
MHGSIKREGFTVKRLLKILIVTVITIPCLALLGFWIYISSLAPKMFAASLLKSNSFLSCQTEEHQTIRIKVGAYSKVLLEQIPPLVSETFLLNDIRFFERRISRKTALRELVWSLVFDFNKLIGREYYGFYDPDILAKVAHNTLVIKGKVSPSRAAQKLLAFKINRTFSKEAILERYLNQIYFGDGVFGVEAAARVFFGKSLADLQIGQIAILNAMAIDYYGGDMERWARRYHKPDLLLKRRNHYLDSMARGELISTEQAEEAKTKSLDLAVNYLWRGQGWRRN